MSISVVRTVLLALIGFMPSEGGGAIGSVDVPAAERRRLARCSLDWVCPTCGVPNRDILPRASAAVGGGEQREVKDKQDKAMKEVADIVAQMAFKVSGTEHVCVVCYVIGHTIVQ